VLGYRWWSLAELVETDEKVYPEALAEQLAAIVAG